MTSSCDLPSEAPSWDTRWIVRAESTSIGVVELLPDGVTLNQPGDAFDVDIDPARFDWTLAELCPPCATFDGLIVPKPAFQGSVPIDTDFPPELVSVTSRSASVTARVRNGFSFDPLRPAAGVFGTLTVTLQDGDGVVLDTEVVPGTDTAFPPGGSVSIGLDVGMVTVSERFTVVIGVDSPAGDPVLIDSSDEIRVDVEPEVVLVEEATVILPAGPVSLEPVAMDLGEIDSEVVDRVEAGALILDVSNPFAVEIDVSLRIKGPTFAPITRDILVRGGQNEVRVDLTGSELRSFLGAPDVVFSGDGAVRAASEAQPVTPFLGIDIVARLDLTLRIGG